MSKLLEGLEKYSEKLNMALAGTGDSVKILTLNDIDNIVDLYKTVYEDLKTAQCEKFIHKLNGEEVEDLIKQDASAIVGYFKDGKHLAGTLYAKPFAKNSPYFQTPTFEGDKEIYAFGGLAVNPIFRGNGIVGKMGHVAYGGVKEAAKENENIAGAGFEISAENFGSILSFTKTKDENGQLVFNFHGIHKLDTEEQDKDLTILGYASFDAPVCSVAEVPTTTLNGSQSKSLEKLEGVLSSFEEQGVPVSTKEIDGHQIISLDKNVGVPVTDVIKYDQTYLTTYPPQLEP